MTPTPTPDLPGFSSRYGVRVARAHDDATWIALGHAQPRRFVAACNRHLRTIEGHWYTHHEVTADGRINIVPRRRTLASDLYWPNIDRRPTYADLLGQVRHSWAVRLPKCNCDPDVVLEVGCEAGHDPDPDPDTWRITWDGITATTPGAFPVTLGMWG